MVELKSAGESIMSQLFAGDVYNSSVYLKRCFPEIRSSIVTAIGQDNLSNKMLKCFESEDINTHFVFRHDNKAPGMYLIETDETGERSFTYWRSDAAARKIVDFLDAYTLAQLSSEEMLFFSGISLAVIEKRSRESFWLKLKTLKDAGVKIVFDPNYRARLWQSEDEAKCQFENAFDLADIALPGVEDLSALYGINSAEDVIEFLKLFGIQEVVVKNGPESVVTFDGDKYLSHHITPVADVVDTTSAGDAFNGVYLGARLSGKTITDAVQLGALAAGTVIQHTGAIAPYAAFKNAMAETYL